MGGQPISKEIIEATCVGITATVAQGMGPIGGLSSVMLGAMAGSFAGKPKTYVVHGAEIKCKWGARPSRLVVPFSHGVYIHDIPQLNVADNVPLKNIQVFGICTNPKNPAVIDQAKALVAKINNRKKGFMDRVYDFICKSPELEVNKDLIEKCGALCTPDIDIKRKWMEGKEDVLIDGEEALLSTCKLSCLYGGEIIISDDGQRK